MKQSTVTITITIDDIVGQTTAHAMMDAAQQKAVEDGHVTVAMRATWKLETTAEGNSFSE